MSIAVKDNEMEQFANCCPSCQITNGETLLAATASGSVCVVNVIANEEVSRLHEPSSSALYSIVASHSGSLLVTGNSEGLVTLWREPELNST